MPTVVFSAIDIADPLIVHSMDCAIEFVATIKSSDVSCNYCNYNNVSKPNMNPHSVAS